MPKLSDILIGLDFASGLPVVRSKTFYLRHPKRRVVTAVSCKNVHNLMATAAILLVGYIIRKFCSMAIEN